MVVPRFTTRVIQLHNKARIFLLVDLREIFFQIYGRGDEKKKLKGSENDQLTGGHRVVNRAN